MELMQNLAEWGGSNTPAKLPDLPNPAPLPFPCPGRETQGCICSFPDGRREMERGMVLGAVGDDTPGR